MIRKILDSLGVPLKWMLLMGVAILAFLGASILSIGIFLGILVVAGMWLTIESVPGVRKFARTRLGIPILSVGAFFLTHLVVGTGTAIGTIAAATALVLKYFLLKYETELVPATKPVLVIAAA